MAIFTLLQRFCSRAMINRISDCKVRRLVRAKRAILVAPPRGPRVGIPVQGERDSGMIPTAFRDNPEQDSGMKANTGSAMKPNSFRPIPERTPD
jgi:hypothetical protein